MCISVHIRICIDVYVWVCERYWASLNAVVGTIPLQTTMMVVMVMVIGNIVGDDDKGNTVGDNRQFWWRC